MPILRTMQCTVCGNQEEEKQKENGNQYPGWQDWGGLSGVMLDGKEIHLCPVCLIEIQTCIDEMRSSHDRVD